MREIKFKVWNKKEKKFYGPFTIEEVGDKGIGTTADIHTWLEYTGLKDKNGKEIYEGDLLILNGDKDAMFEVFYHNEEARFKCCRTHYSKNRCGGYVPEITSKRLEIIGNIYEQPELLKGI